MKPLQETVMDISAFPCRSCRETGLELILDLGRTPLADRLLTMEQVGGEEPVFPLQVAFCPHCSLLQLLHTVPPEVLFCQDYPYFSSFSDDLLAHSRENVAALDQEAAAGCRQPGHRTGQQ